MTTFVILAAIAVAGVYLRWAIRPVLAAYQAGRHIERLLSTLNGGAPGLDRVSRKDRSRARELSGPGTPGGHLFPEG